MVQKLKFFYYPFLLFCFLFTQCGGSATSVYTDTNQVVVDSTNSRLFLTQARGEIFVLDASTQEQIGEERPLVSETNDEAVFNLMPNVTTHLAVYATGTVSRLFVMGAFLDENSRVVLNRIRVLDFDGTTFTEASFSPMELSDGDDSTDDKASSFADMLVDQDNGVLYVTDANLGLLYVMSATDGTALLDPIAIAGEPQGMSLTDGHLFVCNSSSEEAEQVITVLDVSDDSTTTIDIDLACQSLKVLSNGSGVLLLASGYDVQYIYIRSVDSLTYDTSSAIAAAASDSFTDGVLSASQGISSTIEDITLTKDSSGNYFAYLTEMDGNIEYLTVPAALDSYTLETLSTSALNLTKGAVYTNSEGNGVTAFIISESGALVSVDVGSTEVDVSD